MKKIAIRHLQGEEFLDVLFNFQMYLAGSHVLRGHFFAHPIRIFHEVGCSMGGFIARRQLKTAR